MKPGWIVAIVVGVLAVVAVAMVCYDLGSRNKDVASAPAAPVATTQTITPPLPVKADSASPSTVQTPAPQPPLVAQKPPAAPAEQSPAPQPPILAQLPPVTPAEVTYTPPPPPSPTEIPSETPGVPPLPTEDQPEVLTSGPVHEAFDKPVGLDLQEGLTAPQEPPAAIDEDPPDQKPEGDNVVWVPGYWAWDSDRNDFLWVSGCWRNAPPQREWVAGYWSKQTPAKWAWVAGFWQAASADQIEYLPAPPIAAQIETPPPSPMPDRTWIPGCWYWRTGRYVWRAGYWLAQRPDWVWTPSHFIWTPRGYIFVEGHWDYPLASRGLLFAPVFIPTHHLRQHFAFTPSIAIDVNDLTLNMFACPRYSHYYFGDYYADAYLRAGIYPRFDSGRIHTWYDPDFEHDRWSHRDDHGWEDRQRHDYDLRRTDKTLRPPKTYHELDLLLKKLPAPERKSHEFAAPLKVIVARKSTPIRFEQVTKESRSKIKEDATDVLTFRQDRERWESVPLNDHGIVEHKETVTDHKESVTNLTAHGIDLSAPRQVYATKAEDVKIPASEVTHRSKRKATKSAKSAPASPDDEDRRTGGDDTGK